MKNKITSITEKLPQPAVLPDGFYNGISYKDRKYELHTEEGVRGIGFKVVVEIQNGVATFDSVNS